MRLFLFPLAVVLLLMPSVFAQALPNNAAHSAVSVPLVTNITGTQPPTTINVQLLQPPQQTKSAIQEALQTHAPTLVALLVFIGTVIYTLYKARMEARYTYASEIMKFRLRQVEEFYAPALLLIDQSKIVYDKLLWTIRREKPDFSLDNFRLLDHIFAFKNNEPKLNPLIDSILETGEKLTRLISKKSGLIEDGLTPIFIEYQAHFAILNAASKQDLSQTQNYGWQEFGYYPRMLNREIREGFKVVLAQLENYAKAGDNIIARLLKKPFVEIGKYRRLLLDNLAFYEKHADDYATKFDTFDLTKIRQRFIDAVEQTRRTHVGEILDNEIKILDVGCGTGRDTYVFLKKGYEVTAIDASPAMLRECEKKIRSALSEAENELMKKAASKTGCKELTYDEITFQSEFDGIWAAASLLHIPLQQVEAILWKLVQALKPNGILFLSLKYGHGEREYGGRFFTYYSRKNVRVFLKRISRVEKVDLWLSDSKGNVLSRRDQVLAWFLEMIGRYERSLWLNIMLKRRSP